MNCGDGTVCMLLHRSLEHDSRVRREARALAAVGLRVLVLEVGPTGHVFGIERRRVLSERVRRVLPLRIFQLVFMAAFVVAIARERPAVVHAHDVATLLPALIGARMVGASVVYDAHEFAAGVAYRQGLLARLVNSIERAGARRTAAVITVSDAIADRLQFDHGLRHRPVVVRNLCALPRPSREEGLGPLRRRLKLSNDVPLILHQGAPAPERGCEALIDALPQVPDAHLAFLGSGDSAFTGYLATLARGRHVQERVHFIPNVSSEALLQHTSDADLGVILFQPTCENYRLTLPNKLFEYIAAGVAVVGSPVPELESIVRGRGIGWIADSSDATMLAATLRQGLRDGGDPLLRARVRATDADFNWEIEKHRLLALYENLVPRSVIEAR